MIRWRNVFFLFLLLAWAHGMAAAVLFTLGLDTVGGFCAVVALVSGLVLMPVGASAKDQAEDFTIARAMKAEEEVRRLRAELFKHEAD